MEIEPYLTLRTGPQVVFDHLEERSESPRFMVRADDTWTPVTWSGFASQIQDVAGFLRGRLNPGERAAIFAANSVEWFASALGIQSVRGAMVPVYGSSTSAQVEHIISHSDSQLVFVGSAMLGRVLDSWRSDRPLHVVLLEQTDLQGAIEQRRRRREPVPSEDELATWFHPWVTVRALGRTAHLSSPQTFEDTLSNADLNDMALMLYTSGTSGVPKGVPLTHRHVGVNGRDWYQNNAALLDTGLTDLLWLPMSHIFGFGEAGIGNRLGWTSYLSDPKCVMDHLREVRPEVFMSVPSVWEKLAAQARSKTNTEAQNATLIELSGGRLRFCLSGGAGLKPAVKDFFWEHGILIIEGYGLTECSPTLTLNRPTDFRFDSVGKPLESVELRLADDGEILAKGPSVFGGYHKDPGATREAFDDAGWFHTGDVGRWTDDGFLQIVDRKKDILVTTGGKNIAPAGIEQRFADDSLFAHLVVYGDAKKYLVAAIWLNDPEASTETVQERIECVNATLASYETIKNFVVIDEPLTVESGLLTPTLKVRRKDVYARFASRFEALYEEGVR